MIILRHNGIHEVKTEVNGQGSGMTLNVGQPSQLSEPNHLFTFRTVKLFFLHHHQSCISSPKTVKSTFNNACFDHAVMHTKFAI